MPIWILLIIALVVIVYVLKSRWFWDLFEVSFWLARVGWKIIIVVVAGGFILKIFLGI